MRITGRLSRALNWLNGSLREDDTPEPGDFADMDREATPAPGETAEIFRETIQSRRPPGGPIAF